MYLSSSTAYSQNFKLQVFFCDCTGWFVSDLVETQIVGHNGFLMQMLIFQSQFVRYDGTIRDGEPMLDVQPGNVVMVKTSKETHKGRSVVLALGPWAAKFLPRLGLSLPLRVSKALRLRFYLYHFQKLTV